ncbi:Rieske (2Fe-2S) protein [Mucilaginibacter sp. CSA2-8R]|uniref:Rieske (2Fe-2S) protein n=1 Tax=Mucilaginibacter sp. CSA2-8R TaxID=3141542 RepID=UPI00315CB536
MAWYKVLERVELSQPFIKKVNAGGKNVCLINYNKQVFALSASCPHAGADLSQGWCSEERLVCPRHRYEYDLQTGKGAPGQNDYVKTYNVKVEGTDVYVEITRWTDRLKNWIT